MSNSIELCEPYFFGNEQKYINECFEEGWVSSAGKYLDLFELSLSEYTSSKEALACINATSCLHLALKVFGIGTEDEVLIPSLTFIAPVNAVVYANASPLFLDCDSFCNLDIDKTRNFLLNETDYENGFCINKKTGKSIKAIIPVHVFGNAVNLEPIIDICAELNIKIIEDASESLGTFYSEGKLKGKHTGTIGEIGCISFNGNKILTTGGGGVLLSQNEEYALKASYLSKQAKDNPLKFIHNEVGYNYRLSNIQAAMGVAQMENINDALKIKNEIHNFYIESFKDSDGLELINNPTYSKSNNWLSVLKIDKKKREKSATNILDNLNSKNINARPIWFPNHLQKPFKNYQSYEISQTQKLVDQCVCLPSSLGLKKVELDNIVKAINE
tara:strand:+ start:2688 stop:3848 length:1161 start_codon:yes stop_codon:yes gene_type:complete